MAVPSSAELLSPTIEVLPDEPEVSVVGGSAGPGWHAASSSAPHRGARSWSIFIMMLLAGGERSAGPGPYLPPPLRSHSRLSTTSSIP